MATLPDNAAAHLYRAITGKSPAAEGRSLDRRVADIERAAGSRAKAAAAIGVSVETLRRWLSGAQKPSGPNAMKVQRAHRRARLSPGREKRLRNQTPVKKPKPNRHRIRITGTVIVSSDERTERKLDVGDYIPRPVIGDMLDAWLAGDDARAVAILTQGIEDHYVPGMEITYLDGIEFR